MQITKDYFNRITPPDFILCKANNDRIGTLFCTEKKYDRCFNDFDTVTFTTPLFLDDMQRNPYYEAVKVMKYVKLSGIGKFYIDSVKINSEGTDKETKTVELKSYEGLLAQKYLENFAINIEADIEEEDPVTGQIKYGSNAEGSINNVQFYNPYDTQHSLLHLVLEKCPEWSVGHVDESLWKNGAQYQVDRQDIYSFLNDTVTDKTKCFFVFDTLNMTINAYDKDQYGLDTHVYVSYQNLLQNANMNCNVSDIKTCLTVKGSDDMNLCEINFGHPALYNLDYYHSKEYMSDGLYEAYDQWKQLYAEKLPIYTQLLQEQIQVEQQILELQTRFPTVKDIENPKEDYYKWAFDDKYDEATIKQYLTFYGYNDELDKENKSNTSPLGTIYNAISGIQQAQRIKSENQTLLTEEQKEKLSKTAVRFDENGKIHYQLAKAEDIAQNKQENQQKQTEYQKAISAEYQKLHNWGLDKYKADIQEDKIQHKFGNVNMDMRTAIVWTQELKAQWEDELASWNYSPTIGSIDTVFGGSYTFDFDGERLDVAYSPILVDKKGKNPRFLTQSTVINYIGYMLEKADEIISEQERNGQGTWTLEKIYRKVLELDKQGWTIEKRNSKGAVIGQIFVHDIIACLDTWTGINPIPAKDVGKLMHFVGYYGALHQIPKPTVQTLYIIDEHVKTKIDNILKWIQERIDVMTKQLSQLRDEDTRLIQEKAILADEVAIQNNLSHEQWMELSPFIREDQFQSEDYVITDRMTEEERNEQMRNLQKVANEELLKKSTPQLTFDASLINLFDLPEFQDTYANFDVGNYIHVQLRDDYEVKARVLKLSINYYDPTDFSITFSNVLSKEKNIFTDIQDAINNANSAATSLSYGSGAWAKASRQSSKINEILSAGLLDAGQYIKSTSDISEMKIDAKGIFVNTKPSADEDITDSIYIGGGRILFSDDKWNTVREAIGRVNIDGESIFGVIADAVVAGSVYGSTLKGNDIVGGTVQSDDYENGKHGSFLNLKNGTFEFNQNGKTLLALTEQGLEIGGYLTSDDLQDYTSEIADTIKNGLQTTGYTTINGGNITTGKIQSKPHSNQSTSWIDLDNGSFSFGSGALTWDLTNGLKIGGYATSADVKSASDKADKAQTTANGAASSAVSTVKTGLSTTNWTIINGDNIKTGKIQSNDTKSYFDLKNNTFALGSKLSWDGSVLNIKGDISGCTGTFTGSLKGANLTGATGQIGGWTISGKALVATIDNPSEDSFGGNSIILSPGHIQLGTCVIYASPDQHGSALYLYDNSGFGNPVNFESISTTGLFVQGVVYSPKTITYKGADGANHKLTCLATMD